MRTTAIRSLGATAAFLFTSLLGFAGCASLPDVAGTPLVGAGFDAGGGGSSSPTDNPSGTTCVPSSTGATPAAPIDISTLPSCCTTGAAHCVPTADLPAGTAVSELATCTGGACVPDAIIKTGGAPLPVCKSVSGAAGVCLSVCVPQVAQYSTILPQDVCASDERCAPCVSPIDGSDTGACEIGKNTPASGGSGSGGTCTTGSTPSPVVDSGSSAPSAPADAGPPVCPHVGPPLLDPSGLPTCDPNGGAHCLSASLVPAAEASQLATCPTGLCVPDSFIESGGEFIPASCTSILGAEGRCLDEMIPQVAAELSELPVDKCQSFERCVPCYDPTSGAKTGACSLSCDPGPKDPPVKVQTCCSEKGTDVGECLPTSAIPSAEQTSLNKDVCTQTPAATLCVPKEMTAPGFTPPTCTATSLLTFLGGGYTGVCLSKCLDFGAGSGLAIAQGSCDDAHDCAPCVNPLTQAPTGAPGCPGVDAGL